VRRLGEVARRGRVPGHARAGRTPGVLAVDWATRKTTHSYGRTVITEAGTDPHIIWLVYIAAHEPGAGETEASDGKRFPSATSKTNAIEKTPHGYTYLDPAAFPKAFAPNLPPEQAEFEAHSQMLTATGVFTAPVADPARKVKPRWRPWRTRAR
jgi:hypothetical protein